MIPLTRPLSLSIMLEYWRIQVADGQLGMQLKMEQNQEKIYNQQYRRELGLLQFGIHIN